MDRETLLRLFDYDPETGKLFWKRSPRLGMKARTAAGSLCHGYVRVRIAGKLYYAHRLIWTILTGSCATQHIDHVNGIGTDNRASNLREATAAQNAQNKRSMLPHNKIGLLGVHFDPKRKRPWRAQIQVDRKNIQLGTFTTKEEAHQAYLEAKRRLHSHCTI